MILLRIIKNIDVYSYHRQEIYHVSELEICWFIRRRHFFMCVMDTVTSRAHSDFLQDK